MTNHQRRGGESNAKVGKDFELKVKAHFQRKGMHLEENFSVPIGVNRIKKNHSYDLGSESQKLIIECKSHKWTESDIVPSAKMTTWNEVMLYFQSSPKKYKKILVVLRDFSKKKKISLGQYYIRTNGHLIPRGVLIYEFDENEKRMYVLDIEKERQLKKKEI